MIFLHINTLLKLNLNLQLTGLKIMRKSEYLKLNIVQIKTVQGHIILIRLLLNTSLLLNNRFINEFDFILNYHLFIK